MTTSANAMLLIESGISQEGPIILESPLYVVGTASSADITLNNPFISRRHCQIRYQDESFYISDLGSKNGTYLNEMRLDPSEERVLNDGDVISLADGIVVFRFRQATSGTITLPSSGIQMPSKITVETGPREVWIDNKLLSPSLSAKEFNVLELLYRHRGDAVHRDEVARVGWPEREGGDVGNQEIEQCIRRIRRRIEKDPGTPRIIVTVRNYGYRIL